MCSISSNARVLGLDVGEKRIGLALSDALFLTAQPYDTHWRKSEAYDLETLCGIIRKNGVTLLVCGLPRNMDGTEGPQAQVTRAFAQKLSEKCGLSVVFEDERLTTAGARRALIEGGVHRGDRKNVIDMLAAVNILQTYMDRQKAEMQNKKREVKPMTENFDAQGSLIELLDENDNPQMFELIHAMTYEDEDYVVLAPAEDDMDEEETGVVILHVLVTDEDEEYETVEDDDLLDKLFEQFVAEMEEIENFEG